MVTLRKPQLLGFDEYVELERISNVKHEYVAGYLYAMAGASETHNRIALNIAYHLRAAFRGTSCGVFIADMKVRVDMQDVCYYPDVSVVCDPEDDDPYIKRRPCILVEVLSDTTENTDRREKWLAYRSITTLQYYLLVSSDHRRIEYCQRVTGGVWNTAILDTTEPLKLRCNELAADLDFTRVYEDVVLAQS